LSNNLLTKVWQNSRSANGARIVALCLANHDHEDGRGVWFSVETLAQLCNMGVRTTQEAVKKLGELGELTVEIGAGRMGTNVYRIAPPETPLQAPRENGTTPAESAPPPQNPHHPPAESAPPPPQNPHPIRKKIRNRTLSLPAQESGDEGTAASPPVASERAFAFADWFKTTLPEAMQRGLVKSWRESWAKCYDDMIRLDGATPADISAACQWARADRFWSTNFYSPHKLRERDAGGKGVKYLAKFLEHAKAKPPTHNGATRAPRSANAGNANAAVADEY
jgi:hypothetical protein